MPRGRRRVSLVGQQFGKLLVTSEAERHGSKAKWACLCECGQTRVVWQHQLRNGEARMCQECFLPPMIGKTFGRLTVIAQTERPVKKTGRWFRCQCTCGNEHTVRGDQLRNGVTSSCGCYARDIRSDIASRINAKHGLSQSPEHQVWTAMIQRCENPKHISYRNYGAKGITVCDRWQDFSLFIQDMGMRPGPGMTIERRENSKGYFPGNVRWATRLEQAHNTSRNRRITYNGETLLLTEWAARLQTNPSNLSSRLELGWPEHLVVTVPVKTGNRLKSLR